MKRLDLANRAAARSLAEALPETLAEAEALAAAIERAVNHQTSGGVRELRVVVSGETVVLCGHCDTYYCKQLAQEAARSGAPESRALTNAIEVR